MIDDREALARIEQSVGNYLGRCITRGEALEDVIDSLEASGRMADSAVAGEARSWAPSGKARRPEKRAPAAGSRPRDAEIQPQA